jgi:hypothetical protein
VALLHARTHGAESEWVSKLPSELSNPAQHSEMGERDADLESLRTLRSYQLVTEDTCASASGVGGCAMFPPHFSFLPALTTRPGSISFNHCFCFPFLLSEYATRCATVDLIVLLNSRFGLPLKIPSRFSARTGHCRVYWSNTRYCNTHFLEWSLPLA